MQRDAGGDGFISQNEAGQRSERGFSQADEDGDGQLSKSEIESLIEHFGNRRDGDSIAILARRTSFIGWSDFFFEVSAGFASNGAMVNRAQNLSSLCMFFFVFAVLVPGVFVQTSLGQTRQNDVTKNKTSQKAASQKESQAIWPPAF